MEAGEKAHAPWEHGGDAVEAAVEDLPGEEGTRMGLTRKGSEKFADLVVSLGRGETRQRREYTVQPRSFLQVVQFVSPRRSFLTKKLGVLWWRSSALLGQKRRSSM
jgi:hypothetical protein